MIRDIATGVLVALLGIVFFALGYWVLRHSWGANPAFAAGGSAVVALLIWIRVGK